jgi:predicted nucleic acid-binding protein
MHYLSIAPGPRHLELLRRLCDEGDALGDLIADAVIAAVAAEHSAELVTLDRDFARFGSVAHRRPG